MWYRESKRKGVAEEMNMFEEWVKEMANWPAYYKWPGFVILVSIPTLIIMMAYVAVGGWFLVVLALIWVVASISFCNGVGEWREQEDKKVAREAYDNRMRNR